MRLNVLRCWADMLGTKLGDVPLVEFMYLIFSRMPGESYCKQLVFVMYLCDIF